MDITGELHVSCISDNSVCISFLCRLTALLFIIGDGAMEFFTNRIKITSKWTIPNLECHVGGQTDHANFAGTM